MLEGDDGPVDEAGELLDYGLHPHPNEGQLGCHAIDGDRGHICLAKIGLMEHVGVMVQPKQVAHRIGFLSGEESLDISNAGGGDVPFLNCAVRRITLWIVSA
jgi:hypothetical protein